MSSPVITRKLKAKLYCLLFLSLLLFEFNTMKKDKDGWCLDLQLRPDWYMYKFIVDGVWMEDPANPDKVQTEYTTYNSIMKVE